MSIKKQDFDLYRLPFKKNIVYLHQIFKDMAVIIGRKQEQKELTRLYHSGEAEMVVVYGRRRVGKTYLVNQVFAQTGFAFKVTGLYKQKMPVQLKNFSMALDEFFHEGERKLPVSWMDAFAQLKASS